MRATLIGAGATAGLAGFPGLALATEERGEGAQVGHHVDDDVPPYAIRVMRDGTELEIFGGFRPGLVRAFAGTLLRNPNLKVVHFSSGGGRIDVAVAIGHLIAGRKLDTYVASECHSACTVAFAAGRRRWLDKDASLGFHAPLVRGGILSKLLAGSPFGAMAMSYRIAGFSEPFIARATTTPHADLWRPTLAELRAAGVVSDVSDGSQFAWSGLGPNPAMRDFADSAASVDQTFGSLRDHDPRAFDRFVDLFATGYADGRSRAAVIHAYSDAIGTMLQEKWVLADDASMVALASLMADEYQALGKKAPAACFRYAKGRMGIAEFRATVPAEVWAAHVRWQAAMIATARPGAHALDNEAGARRRHKTLVRRLGRERAALVDAGSVPPARHRAYCDAVIAEYRAIARLPDSEAGPMMRTILQGVTDDVPTGSTR